MAHLTGKLTIKQIESATNDGGKVKRLSDGSGLHLLISPNGSKSWVLRTVVKGKRKDIGLGGLDYTPLQDARRKALEMRAVARNGGDPTIGRQKVIPTFAELAQDIHKERLPTWKNPKHAQQWIHTLEVYAFPEIGELTVDAIDSAAILKVLSPIWVEKHETARRVSQRMGAVLDVAKARKYRAGENPVQEVKVLDVLPKVKKQEKHHGAMRWQDVPAFYANLKTHDATAALALRFLILTAARTSEVLGAEWSEIEGNIWTIPAERMKEGRAHQVPLSADAMAILEKMRGLSDVVIFEGQRRGKPLSNMAMENVLRRMGVKEQGVTVHGFRSSFRDWASDSARAPRELAEAALAHSVGNKVEAAYARSTMLERPVGLMDRWAGFVSGDEGKSCEVGMKTIRFIEFFQTIINKKWNEQEEFWTSIINDKIYNFNSLGEPNPSPLWQWYSIADVIEQVTLNLLYSNQALFVNSNNSERLIEFNLSEFTNFPPFRPTKIKWDDPVLDSMDVIMSQDFHMPALDVREQTYPSVDRFGAERILPTHRFLPIFFERNTYSISFVGYNLAEAAESKLIQLISKAIQSGFTQSMPKGFFSTQLISETSKIYKKRLEPYEHCELLVSSDLVNSPEFYRQFEIEQIARINTIEQIKIVELLTKSYPKFISNGDKSSWCEGESWSDIVSKISPEFYRIFGKPPSKTSVQRAAGYSKGRKTEPNNRANSKI